MSADFLMTFFGVRIQVEYLKNLIRITDEGRLAAAQPGVNFTRYPADNVSNMFYALLAYQLPLDKWLGGTTITPYFIVEYDKPFDSQKETSSLVFNFGLNLKPTSYVALKLEGSQLQYRFVQDESLTTVWTVASQLAVSF